jgi:tRNA pseudouridine38-40 synthase
LLLENASTVPTYRLVVEYDGSGFHGLQFQPDLRTVAGELEASLTRIFHEPVAIAAAGRTDTGVHATAQVIAFSAAREFPIERLARALNGNTPPDLIVHEAALVADDFSPRFDARERRYEYLIINRSAPSALWRTRAWHVPYPIDLDGLAAAAAPLVGSHDFVAFCGEAPERGGTVRELFAIEATRDGDFVRVSVRGSGFLHRMVRIIVGSLVDAATGYRPIAFVGEALAARDRTLAGTTAPPHGLYFAGARFDDGEWYRPVVLRP